MSKLSDKDLQDIQERVDAATENKCELCPICKQPMEYKGRGYSQDFGCEVDLYHCNRGCWTQKRNPVQLCNAVYYDGDDLPASSCYLPKGHSGVHVAGIEGGEATF